jgi:hypothetical protein
MVQSEPSSKHCYPADLAIFVRERWKGLDLIKQHPLMDERTLEDFFSSCYHASMLREEERPVTFGAILVPPESFSKESFSTTELYLLRFAEPLSFTPSVLRRLSVATPHDRMLMCVSKSTTGELKIWGLINTHVPWLGTVYAGGQRTRPLPVEPVVYVRAAAALEVYMGEELVAGLVNGTLTESRTNLFQSQWFTNQFSSLLDRVLDNHIGVISTRSSSNGTAIPLFDPDLHRRIAERMMIRVLSVLRESRHGGTIIFIPDDGNKDIVTHELIDLRYRFSEGKERYHFSDVLTAMLDRLAEIFADKSSAKPTVSWEDFEAIKDYEIMRLDEKLFEFAQLVAGLAATDGAVVFTKSYELMGFGGMISGQIPPVLNIDRAYDVEGISVSPEDTSRVGTRHLSAYRLASVLPGAVIVVISQDGGVQFVAQKDNRVTCWHHD